MNEKWSDQKLLANRFILLLIIGAGLFICSVSVSTEMALDTSSRFIDLRASVKFDGIEFSITNENNFDWTNVKMELNDVYNLRIRRMQAGKTYYVGTSQFAKGDGTRFNTFTTKLLKANIFCDTPEGRGSWFWWK